MFDTADTRPSYGLTRTLKGVSYSDAIAPVKEALAAEGFGILTEIDVTATLKKKINVDFGANYIILGACNPKMAHQALTAEAAIGLLLPCNVVVTEDTDGNAVVGAIDPNAMFKIVDNAEVASLAGQVREMLFRAIDNIKA